MAFFKKKEVKTYGSVMSAFSKQIEDLKEVVEREDQSVFELEAEKSVIDVKINASKSEIENCSSAIDVVQNMFPNL